MSDIPTLEAQLAEAQAQLIKDRDIIVRLIDVSEKQAQELAIAIGMEQETLRVLNASNADCRALLEQNRQLRAALDAAEG